MAKTGYAEPLQYDAQDVLACPTGDRDPFAVRLYLNSRGARASDNSGRSKQGMTPGRPYATLARAIATAKAIRGATARTPIEIVVAATHRETLPDAQTTIDVPICTLICPSGVADGPRPIFTVAATNARIGLGADYVSVLGLGMQGNGGTAAAMLNIGGPGTAVRGCRIGHNLLEVLNNTVTTMIRSPVADSAQCRIFKNRLYGLAVNGSGIIFSANCADMVVEGNVLAGTWNTSNGGGIFGANSVALTRHIWRDNDVVNLGTGAGIGSAYDNAAVDVTTIRNAVAAAGTAVSFGGSTLHKPRGNVAS